MSSVSRQSDHAGYCFNNSSIRAGLVAANRYNREPKASPRLDFILRKARLHVSSRLHGIRSRNQRTESSSPFVANSTTHLAQMLCLLNIHRSFIVSANRFSMGIPFLVRRKMGQGTVFQSSTIDWMKEWYLSNCRHVEILLDDNTRPKRYRFCSFGIPIRRCGATCMFSHGELRVNTCMNHHSYTCIKKSTLDHLSSTRSSH
jgi:hypothetical protein